MMSTLNLQLMGLQEMTQEESTNIYGGIPIAPWLRWTILGGGFATGLSMTVMYC